jgi:hypothetical protein
MLARVGQPWLAVVVANNLPRAGKRGAVPLKLEDILGSVNRLAWARDNGCPWEGGTCSLLAAGGHVDVLQWARGHGCPWDLRNVVIAQRWADTCTCCSGRGRTAARGTR